MTQAVLYNHTATLLEDGRVLVTGGQTSRRSSQFSLPPAVASAEIYDPSTGRWSPTRPMFDPRRHHGGVLLEDGMVLVSGGLTEEFTTHVENAEVDYVFPIASAEVYDPSTETWSRVSDMPEETVDFVGTQNNLPAILLDMLENGKVLAAGGLGPSAALYNASSGTWDSAGEVTSDDYRTRDWHTSALLGDGKVLYIGGWTGSAAMDSVDLYNPLTGSVSSTGSMSWPRRFPSAAGVLLPRRRRRAVIQRRHEDLARLLPRGHIRSLLGPAGRRPCRRGGWRRRLGGGVLSAQNRASFP